MTAATPICAGSGGMVASARTILNAETIRNRREQLLARLIACGASEAVAKRLLDIGIPWAIPEGIA